MPRRTPTVTRDQVAPEHQAAYDEITAIRGRPPTVGPTSVLINSPEMAVRANRLSEYLGEQSSLSEKVRRLAGLIGARSMDCQFVWNAHCAAGRRAGLSDELVDALRDKRPLPAINPEDAAVVNYGIELTSANQVSQETFQAALDQSGRAGTDGVHHLHGLLPDAGPERQRFHHRPARRYDRASAARLG